MSKKILNLIKKIKAKEKEKLYLLVISLVTFILIASPIIYSSARDGNFLKKSEGRLSQSGYGEVLTISNINVSVSENSATITWTTNLPASSIVNYGTTTSYDLRSTDNSLVTSHSITLINLLYETTYNYQVSSIDADNNRANSANDTFTTGIQWVKSKNQKMQAKIRKAERFKTQKNWRSGWNIKIKQKNKKTLKNNNKTKKIIGKKIYRFVVKNKKNKVVKDKINLKIKMETRSYYKKNYTKPKTKLLLLVKKDKGIPWEEVKKTKFNKTNKYVYVKLKYLKKNYRFALIQK